MGMADIEHLLAVFPGFCHLVVSVPQHSVVLHIDGCPEHGHTFRTQLCPHVLFREQYHAVGMVGKG